MDYIAGVESRGFIIGAALAARMKKGMVLIRKSGKLPFKTVGVEYTLEYGSGFLEMHSDALDKGQSVVLADDLLATGGTSRAAAKLVEKVGGRVAAYVFLLELEGLHGRKRLGEDVITLIKC